jgi:hypothetical protein
MSGHRHTQCWSAPRRANSGCNLRPNFIVPILGTGTEAVDRPKMRDSHHSPKRQSAMSETALRQLRVLALAAEATLLDSVLPIYRADEQSRPEHLGTSVLISVGEYHFLVTAAHVVDRANGGALYAGVEAGLIELPAAWYTIRSATTGAHRTDKIDLAIAELTRDQLEALDATRAVTADQMNAAARITRREAYLAMGYPESQSKIFAGKRQLRVQPVAFLAQEDHEAPLEVLGFLPDRHFALAFDTRAALSQSGRMETAPTPHGMSGGGVWALGAASPVTQTTFSIGLVGVLTEVHARKHQLMVATRITVLTEALRARYPVLRSALPTVE